ncbi:MAG: sugar phosphate isomerase/epimerase family protein [Trueperaceae bacterium]
MSAKLRIGNAPCSWGTIENIEGERLSYHQMLEELSWAGYTGTELGDWGFMPTDPKKLKAELAALNLSMIGSWVSVRLYDAAYHQRGVEQAVNVARLLVEVGGSECIINIGDDHSTVHERHYNTGRIKEEHSLSEEGWQIYAEGATKVAEAVKCETGLRSCLHQHGSTYVETPAETEKFLSLTDPALLGLCFDTGHYMLGGGKDAAGALEHFSNRVWLVHFKDFNPDVIPKAIENNWNYQEMIGQGVFTELGKGAVDFVAVKRVLESMQYTGWITVEQDVLPGMGEPKESAKRNREFLAGIGL